MYLERCLSQEVATVSYTHLDVYKRQDGKFIEEVGYYDSTKDPSAVSYTHLDVYKRQQTLNKKNELERFSQTIIKLETEAAGQGRDVPENEEHERELNAYLADKDHPRFDQEKEAYQSKCQILEQKSTQAK